MEKFENNQDNKKEHKTSFDIIVEHFGGYEELKNSIRTDIDKINEGENKEVKIGTVKFTEFVFRNYPNKDLIAKKLKILNHIVNGITNEIIDESRFVDNKGSGGGEKKLGVVNKMMLDDAKGREKWRKGQANMLGIDEDEI